MHLIPAIKQRVGMTAIDWAYESNDRLSLANESRFLRRYWETSGFKHTPNELTRMKRWYSFYLARSQARKLGVLVPGITPAQFRTALRQRDLVAREGWQRIKKIEERLDREYHFRYQSDGR